MFSRHRRLQHTRLNKELRKGDVTMTRYTHALKTNKEELKRLLLWLGILIAINVTLTILLPFYLSFPLSLLALVLVIWHIIKNRTKTSQF